jgi:hypothetical protein
VRLVVSEASLLAGVLELARRLGWLAYHTHDSRRSAAGFPDLVLCRPPRVVFAELKREGERPRLEQREWLEALAQAGAETYLWTPAEWADGAVEAVLR